MIPLERTVVVLLAAGHSVRFGEHDKLLAILDDKPLAWHAMSLLSSLPLLKHYAVIGPGDPTRPPGDMLQAAGFELIENPRPEQGQDTSVRLGLARALRTEARAILICLADMPNVTGDHVRALAAAADEGRVAISSSGSHRSPPALIPRSVAEAVLGRPDTAVRSLIEPAIEVIAPDRVLADIDTPADLAALGSSR